LRRLPTARSAQPFPRVADAAKERPSIVATGQLSISTPGRSALASVTALAKQLTETTPSGGQALLRSWHSSTGAER